MDVGVEKLSGDETQSNGVFSTHTGETDANSRPLSRSHRKESKKVRIMWQSVNDQIT